MNRAESATRFAERVSGTSEAIYAAQCSEAYNRSEIAAKRRQGVLRGLFEHESFDTAARRHYAQSSMPRRRYANIVTLLAYAAAIGLLHEAYRLISALQ